MKYKLIIYNSEKDTAYDYSQLIEEVTYTTNQTGSPGKLKFTYIEQKEINMMEGAQVQFYVDEKKIFLGYVFIIEKDRWGEVEVTAYDQIRYLKANASYSFTGMTVGRIIQRIAVDFGLYVGEIENTGYAIPSLTKEDKSCLDIIEYALDLTLINTGRTYVFYDDFGKLCLKEAANLKNEVVLGDKSNITEYTYSADIDSDTYNQVKLARPNSETGRADVYVFKDSSTQKKWGLLQYYEKVDENLNAAQIDEQGRTMMAYYNRVLKSISADCIGVVGLKAGMMSLFKLEKVPGLSQGFWLILDKVEHTFKQGTHEMSVEAKMLSI